MLSACLRDLDQTPGFGETVNMPHFEAQYDGRNGTINPTGIVPLGPTLDFDTPHGRAALPVA